MRILNKKNIIDSGFLRHACVAAVFLYLLRNMFSKWLAYSDFTPFSPSGSLTLQKLLFIWDKSFIGLFDPKSISYAVRFLFESASLDHPSIAQSLYILVFFLVGYYGTYFFLKRYSVNPFVNFIVPFFFIINPVMAAELSNGAMGILIIYSLIPFLYILFGDLLFKFTFRKGFLFALIVAFDLLNIQTAFWVMSGFPVLVIISLLLGKKIKAKNLLLIGLCVILGFLINNVSLFSFFNISGNYSNISYVDTFKHTYAQAYLYNLFRFTGNNGSSQPNLGYFDANTLNYAAFSFFAIIIFYFRKKITAKERIASYWAITTLLILMAMMTLLKGGYLDELIAGKNLLIVSLRNPQKLFYLFAFCYVLMLGFSLNDLLKVFKKYNLEKAYFLLLAVIAVIYAGQNRYFFTGDFGLSLTKGEGGYYIEEKYAILYEKFRDIDKSSYILYLPFDYNIQLKTTWEDRIVRYKMGGSMSDSGSNENVLKDLYAGFCAGKGDLGAANGKLNIDYIVLDKNPASYIKHSGADCRVETLYGTPYVWGEYEYFNNLFSGLDAYYEDEDFKILKIEKRHNPEIFAISNIYRFDSAVGTDDKYDFITRELKDDFNFIAGENAPFEKTFISLRDLFADAGQADIKSGKLVQSIEAKGRKNGDNAIYVNRSKNDLYYNYDSTANKITFYRKAQDNLHVNGEKIGMQEEGGKILYQEDLDSGNKYYVNFGSQINAVESGQERRLGAVSRDASVILYVASGPNIIPNASFREGLWNKEVGDCNNYDRSPALNMKLGQREADDPYLQLEAVRHIACTTNVFDLAPEKDYLFSFDYQSPNAKNAGYYLEFNDENKTVIREKIFIENAGWHTYAKRIRPPKGATGSRLYLYAYSSDEKANVINRYDNFSLLELGEKKEIRIKYAPEFEKGEIELKDNNIIEYAGPGYGYENIIPNGSFENGLWDQKVGDCNDYDDDPKMDMDLWTDGNGGSKYLQLEATRHNACTSAVFPVDENSSYLFSFDYQSPNAADAGYYLQFNDGNKTVIKGVLNAKNGDWQNFNEKVKVPAGAATAKLYIYAYESDGEENNIVRYDNIKLIEVPNLDGKYYYVSDPKPELRNPEKVDFEDVDPTRKLVRIKGASTSFILAFSESYHPQWQLEVDDAQVQGVLNSWIPFAQPYKVPPEMHFKLNNFLNAWYVDIDALCTLNGRCRENPDGTYDMELMIEFVPQRWFYLGLAISATILLVCLSYLICTRRKKLGSGL